MSRRYLLFGWDKAYEAADVIHDPTEPILGSFSSLHAVNRFILGPEPRRDHYRAIDTVTGCVKELRGIKDGTPEWGELMEIAQHDC